MSAVYQFFVPGNVRSLKNSKKFAFNRNTGRMFIAESNISAKYRKEKAGFYYLQVKEIAKFIEEQKLEKPYRVGFFFTRDSKRRFDYINVAQLPLDMMVTAGIFEDDDASNIIPVFQGYKVDAKNAGVTITIYNQFKNQ